ncbi:hypothetical protein [Dyadobacter bucti]|uniref:hypothetical protein n=1 Tax=Dyadobacter bucti TaxID=2572203 RepID=UPI003F70B116
MKKFFKTIKSEQIVQKLINSNIEPINARYFYIILRVGIPLVLFCTIFIFHPGKLYKNIKPFALISVLFVIEAAAYLLIEFYTKKRWNAGNINSSRLQQIKLNKSLILVLNKFIAITLLIDFALLISFHTVVGVDELGLLFLLAHALIFFHSFYTISQVEIDHIKDYSIGEGVRDAINGSGTIAFILYNIFYWYLQPDCKSSAKSGQV